MITSLPRRRAGATRAAFANRLAQQAQGRLEAGEERRVGERRLAAAEEALRLAQRRHAAVLEDVGDKRGQAGVGQLAALGGLTKAPSLAPRRYVRQVARL